MNLGSMADLAADITPEKRARIDAIKSEMVDAERGHELASLRKAQGMTQVQVAKAMGVTQGRISQIERGGVRPARAAHDRQERRRPAREVRVAAAPTTRTRRGARPPAGRPFGVEDQTLVREVLYSLAARAATSSCVMDLLVIAAPMSTPTTAATVL